ncbi:MAG: hypothetical protein O1I36_10645 [Cylindrospermopsis raciborskii PAMP2011]|nr:hypothetical protein [Cylindrospermopsis raciborskii PAMP2011]
MTYSDFPILKGKFEAISAHLLVAGSTGSHSLGILIEGVNRAFAKHSLREIAKNFTLVPCNCYQANSQK